MAYKDNIYKASDFTFKDGYITCDGLYMATPRACCVPKEVLESMKETFQIKLKPGSEFVFNPPTDINRFFKAMYKPYLKYLKKLLVEKNIESIKSSIDEDISINLDSRIYIKKKSIKRIEEEGCIDISRILPERIVVNDDSLMGYYTIDEIVEFGKDAPSEFEEHIADEDIFFDTEDFLSDVIKKAVINRFAHLEEDEIELFVNAPKHRGDKVVCQIVEVGNDYQTTNAHQKIFTVNIETFDVTLNLLVDLSGEEFEFDGRVCFSEEDIEQIDRMIKKMPEGKEKDALVKRLDKIKSGSSKIQIVDFDNAEQYNNIHFRKILEENSLRIFSFTDWNNHDSDGYYYWWNSPSVHTYISVKRSKKTYFGVREIMMFSCDEKKATYFFYTNEENYMPLVFAVWAYFGSDISNKRQNFNSSIFKYFGMTYFVK